MPSLQSEVRVSAKAGSGWQRLGRVLSTSNVEVTNEYVVHFYYHDVYISQHDRKYMTGDKMKILLLKLLFLLHDHHILIISYMLYIYILGVISGMISGMISYTQYHYYYHTQYLIIIHSFIQTAKLAEMGTSCASWKRPGSNPGPWAPEPSALPTALLAPVISHHTHLDTCIWTYKADEQEGVNW